jgi:hypothetical protein
MIFLSHFFIKFSGPKQSVRLPTNIEILVIIFLETTIFFYI